MQPRTQNDGLYVMLHGIVVPVGLSFTFRSLILGDQIILLVEKWSPSLMFQKNKPTVLWLLSRLKATSEMQFQKQHGFNRDFN